MPILSHLPPPAHMGAGCCKHGPGRVERTARGGRQRAEGVSATGSPCLRHTRRGPWPARLVGVDTQ
jgi:hypothetical protein